MREPGAVRPLRVHDEQNGMMAVTRIELDFGDGISGGIGEIKLAGTRRRRFFA